MAEKMVQVVATKRGFDGTCIRERGDHFTINEGVFHVPSRPPSWFERVDPNNPKKIQKATDGSDDLV